MKENRCLNPKAFSWQPFVPERVSEREKENISTPEAYTFYVWIDVRIDPSISVGLSRRKREFVMVSDEIERHLFQFQRMRRRPKTIQVIFVPLRNLQSESFNLLSLMCVCVFGVAPVSLCLIFTACGQSKCFIETESKCENQPSDHYHFSNRHAECLYAVNWWRYSGFALLPLIKYHLLPTIYWIYTQ